MRGAAFQGALLNAQRKLTPSTSLQTTGSEQVSVIRSIPEQKLTHNYIRLRDRENDKHSHWSWSRFFIAVAVSQRRFLLSCCNCEAQLP